MSPADAALPMTPVPFRVADRRQETEDTWTLELEPQNGRSLPAFQPGQFTMLYAFGAGEVPISVSGDLSAADGRLVHTIRAVGAVTRPSAPASPARRLACAGPSAPPGPWRTPKGPTWCRGRRRGPRPAAPFVYHLLSNRERFGNVAILYGGRTPADMLYPGELESVARPRRRPGGGDVDSAPANWRGRVGVVTKLIPRAEVDPGQGHRARLRARGDDALHRRRARGAGLAEERIHLSIERNMHCAIGMCGHCQFREHFICKDGPVFTFPRGGAADEGAGAVSDKPTLAVWKFASCDGCQLSLLDLEDELLTLTGAVEIAYFLEARRRPRRGRTTCRSSKGRSRRPRTPSGSSRSAGSRGTS